MAAAAVFKETPFTYTAPSDIGSNRDTMLQNELLHRARLGSSKIRGFKLPPAAYTYGLPNGKREYTVSDALHGWPGLVLPTQDDQKKRKWERDYLSLNRAAVTNGMVKSNEYSNFRALRDAVRRIPSDTKLGREYTIDPSWIFGMPSRPSTPIFDLLEHKYQKDWVAEQRALEMERRKRVKMAAGKRPGPVYETRTALMRRFQHPVEKEPLWHMPRFARNAKPHLQTFPTSKDKEDAFAAFESDKASRRGVFKSGVYKNAQDAVNFAC